MANVLLGEQLWHNMFHLVVGWVKGYTLLTDRTEQNGNRTEQNRTGTRTGTEQKYRDVKHSGSRRQLICVASLSLSWDITNSIYIWNEPFSLLLPQRDRSLIYSTLASSLSFQ